MFQVFARINEGISELYESVGVTGVRPRYSMALMFLEDGPMSIRQVAFDCGVSHSAMSQTISAMRKAGLVESVTSREDARRRVITLTDKGREFVPLLRAEWAATEAVHAQLEAETSYSLSKLAEELHAALDRKPFIERALEVIELPDGRR
ncbi:hypothetical protein GCM10022288_23960 [Gryllotalpicola kribbensis]|uniref:HTH marR-type domain-containing protein n=1 Tax=Gryllotalpicola kribbensis TaxID=993084 RepID=A0ABP8AWU5_9MICO